MKLPSPIARSQALGQGKSKMRPALGENPVIRSSDRGSIPLASTRGISSAGRAPALQAGGQRFEPANLHQVPEEEVSQENTGQ